MPTLREIQRELILKENVVFAAMNYRRGIMEAGVTRKIAEPLLAPKDIVPPMIHGIRTDVIEVGVIRALNDIDPTGRLRPCPGGMSVGHTGVTAGTLGMMVTKNDKNYILSNNHVLANSNDAALGDPIVQPGVYDGGAVPEDIIAYLDTFVEINWMGDEPSDCPLPGLVAAPFNVLAWMLGRKSRLTGVIRQETFNLVDCALAEEAEPGLLLCEVLEIGNPGGYQDTVTQGDPVKKFGRTTRFNTGAIQATDATVQVQYGGGRIALFEDQLVTTPMLQGGDSGSVLFLGTDENLVVGLGFAGSDTLSIFNRIANVREALGF